jgi:hypothetical protein
VARTEDVAGIVRDLIRVMHQQAKELERLAEHVGRPVGFPGNMPELTSLCPN